MDVDYVEQPGPGIPELPAGAPAGVVEDAQLLPVEVPKWERETIEQLLRGTGAGVHWMWGVSERDWLMTKTDLERIAPPLPTLPVDGGPLRPGETREREETTAGGSIRSSETGGTEEAPAPAPAAAPAAAAPATKAKATPKKGKAVASSAHTKKAKHGAKTATKPASHKTKTAAPKAKKPASHKASKPASHKASKPPPKPHKKK
jgi:hypothetical protein